MYNLTGAVSQAAGSELSAAQLQKIETAQAYLEKHKIH